MWRSLRLAAVAVAGAGLIGFHLALLWLRLADGTLWSPAVAARWAAAVVLSVTLVVLRRAGIPLFWGRKALVFWLLVLVLHATSGATAPDADLLTLPIAATTVLCTLLLVLRLPLPSTSLLLRAARRLLRGVVPQRRRAWLRVHVPRPPPLALAR